MLTIDVYDHFHMSFCSYENVGRIVNPRSGFSPHKNKFSVRENHRISVRSSIQQFVAQGAGERPVLPAGRTRGFARAPLARAAEPPEPFHPESTGLSLGFHFL